MKKIALDEMKRIQVDILKDVHQFCIENNIHYTLIFGTLLGAIRHKGYIPWDRCLSELYGDYMQLPPEEERRQHSCDHTQFYWKTK